MARGNAMQGQGSGPRKMAKLTGGASLSAGIGGGRRNVSARGRTGPWAASLAGPVRSPRPVFLFFLYFHFYFSVSSFLSYLLQKLSKLIQTFSYILLIFNTKS
jgi:hypothetical protein